MKKRHHNFVFGMILLFSIGLSLALFSDFFESLKFIFLIIGVLLTLIALGATFYKSISSDV